jgi:hypothetical protein
MDRRDLSKFLLASTAGAALLSRQAQAQSCTAPCYAQTSAEVSAGVTPTNTAFPELHAFRYMTNAEILDVIAGTETFNVTTALQNALNVAAATSYRAQIYCPRGQYKHSGLVLGTQGIGVRGDGRRETVLHYIGAGHGITVTSGAGNVRLSNLQAHGNASALSLVRWTDAANGVMEGVHVSANGATADLVILEKASFYHRMVDCMIDGGGTAARGLLMQANGAASGPNSSSNYDLRVQECTTAVDIVDGNNLLFVESRLELGITTGFDIRANTRDITIISPRIDWTVNASKGFNVRAGAARVHILNPRNDIAGAGAVLLSDAGTSTYMIEGDRVTGKPIFNDGAFILDEATNNPYLDFGTNAGPQRALIQVTGTLFDFYAATGFGMRFRTNGGAATPLQFGAGNTIGFYGTAAQAKPTVTGAKGGNAALASLLTKLAALGLITDSST